MVALAGGAGGLPLQAAAELVAATEAGDANPQTLEPSHPQTFRHVFFFRDAWFFGGFGGFSPK